MRMLLRVSIPVEAGNAAAKAGTLASTCERILADLKPEAAYFFADDNGERSGSVVFDMKDTSQIPAIAEPWLFVFNAKVSLRPVCCTWSEWNRWFETPSRYRTTRCLRQSRRQSPMF